MARQKKFTIPLALVGGVVASPAVRGAITSALGGNWNESMAQMGYLVGVDKQGQFNVARLIKNMGPIVVGMLAHKFLGGTLGLNRALGRAQLPVLRI